MFIIQVSLKYTNLNAFKKYFCRKKTKKVYAPEKITDCNLSDFILSKCNRYLYSWSNM